MKKLSVEECAQELGISVPTVRTWIRDRRIPFYRVGRRVLFDEREVADLFKQGRVEPLSPMPVASCPQKE